MKDHTEWVTFFGKRKKKENIGIPLGVIVEIHGIL